MESTGEKQATKSEDGVEFRASDYADVGDSEKPSTWKLRLAEGRSGNFTNAQIARAITAMQPSGFRGQRIELESGLAAVKRRVSAAIGKLGDDAQKKNLRERLAKIGGVPKAKALDEDGEQLALGEDEKCAEEMAMPAPYRPFGGATSFGEIDAWRETQELTEEVSDLTWQFRAIQDNIMGSPLLEPAEKARAIADAAADFQRRIRDVPSDGEKAGDLEDLAGAVAAAKEGKRLGKQQMGVLKRLFDDIKALFTWGNYEEDEKLPATGVGFKLVERPGHPTRWVSFSSNAFEDIEGELFTTKALEDAVAWADATGERGPLRLFHVPGADIGHVDFQGVKGRVLIESGTFADTPLGAAAEKYFKEHRDVPHGVSIGYIYRIGDEKDATYDWLRFRERSVCPPGTAANPWTEFKLGGGNDMNAVKEGFLKDVLGPELAKSVIETAEARTKELEEAGIRFKEQAGADGKAKDELPDFIKKKIEASKDEKAGDMMMDADHEDMDEEKKKDAAKTADPSAELAEAVKALALNVKSWTERLGAVEAKLGLLAKSDDEKVADAFAARGAPQDRPSESDKTVIDETKEGAAGLIEKITGQSIDERTKARELAIAPVAAYLSQIGVPTT